MKMPNSAFDMSDMLSDINIIAQDTVAKEIKMISISELHDSPDNFFKLSNIEELAESILAQGGVKENLIVRALETGGYEIISGHRRKSAVQYLIDRGENISHNLPCLIQNYSDENDKMMNLIMMNVSQRVLTDAELIECYNKLHKVFEEKKALGEKFGRMRTKIAEMLNVSTGQVSKIENIQKNAIPEVIEAIEQGSMSISTANRIASLATDEQKELVEDKAEQITPKKIEQKKAEKKCATSGTFEDKVRRQFLEILDKYRRTDDNDTYAVIEKLKNELNELTERMQK